MTKELAVLFDRDLNKLAEEIKAYPDEKLIWSVKGDIKNTAGNLCLHLLGNLNYFIGGVLGKTGYVRKRDEEFSLKNVPAADLVKEIENLRNVISKVLPQISGDLLKELFPSNALGKPMTTEHFLLHLYGHLNYHLGQINYHRRMISA